ncbi:hypothetical protein A1O1_01952 [Capronia coronata CBS 617.96]|uniref:Integrase zinc-binding domain-containing protein n=1 Tax=Capronia coronata CBS 617.96 TaxID=1182541 RepID=W9YV49_9EURO|nr:uncharacterized protein A1O1_01952 [Capronia coronata CBS 617.96]EXJ93560.1 hypothetical protein A1O1_01952 [Capronia coronata CBS 617.96]
MTDYAPRSSQDYNTFFPNPHVAMPQYSNGNGFSYLYGNGQVQYQTVSAPCPTYSTTYAPSPGTPSSAYMPNGPGLPLQYPVTNNRVPTLPSQSRALPHATYYATTTTNHRSASHHPRLVPPREFIQMDGTECQDSPNENTMLSEPVVPPLEGYPDVHEFDELMKRYVQDLSPKKQDKALIHARRAANIKQVLIDKKTTSIESAQFRFWVKKMFTLQPPDGKAPELRKICHEGKPVAVREKLFKILTKAHKQCQHGGRDKTSAQVRRVYSWVPKELISRFVKLCPTCQVRRGTNRNSPPESEKSPEARMEAQSPDTASATDSRKDSMAGRQPSLNINLPLQSAGFNSSSAFQQQNRWMTPLQPQQTETHRINDVSNGTNLNSHETYNTMPPMPMNCTNSTLPGLAYSTVNNFGSDTTSSSAYSSDSLTQVTHGHVPTENNYLVKAEHHYI